MTVLAIPSLPHGLPPLSAALLEHQAKVHQYLHAQIEAAYGFLPFDQWMQAALYAPGLGYYTAGSTKFGGNTPTGDFTTAPELSPLFGQTLARQVAQILQQCDAVTVLEFGAGSGALAATLIPALRSAGIEPHYQILELSPDLRQRQQERLAALQANVVWLDELPTQFVGCVLANEVLDAMPAVLFHIDEDLNIMELGVQAASDDIAAGLPAPFVLAARPAPEHIQQLVLERVPRLPTYQSELNLNAEAWVRSMGEWLHKGAALLIDYGFPQREYYHEQRAEGTLMCHFRHLAHAQPLVLAGMQDITTHVDFTAMADAALESGLDVLGYTSQARFLMNCGLPGLLAAASPDAESRDNSASAIAWNQQISQAQKLLSEAEMGELFKVIALGKDIDPPLLGFSSGDRRDRL